MSDNLCCVLRKPGDMVLENRDCSPPGFGEVQVAVHSVGICGSDLHLWRHGRISSFIMEEPIVLGHESSGTVTALGEGVRHLKVGDRVAMEPAVPCRYCEFCKIGRYNLCPDVTCLSCPPTDGSLARVINHAADFCFRLPENMTMEEGALLEPLSVGFYACERGKVEVGNSVLICGAGPIGLVSLLVAKARGASQVVITDINPARLEFAKSLGADHTVLVDTESPETIASKVSTLLGDRADITLECSGAESSIQLGIYATRSGGRVCLVGLGYTSVQLPLSEAAIREVDILGVFRYRNSYPVAIRMVSTGAVDVKPLVSHRYTLEQAAQAFQHAHTGNDNAVKILINCEKK